jgi:P27 family predicted phage terminase small subunit
MGRQKTPTAILKLRDSRESKEREKRGEPMPEQGVPERPANIVKESRQVWTVLTKILDDMGVLTTIDGAQLERYCLNMVEWRQLQRIMAKMNGTDDMLFKAMLNEDLLPVIRNVWLQCQRLDTAMKQIEIQYGMTPSSRARITCLVYGDRKTPDADNREELFFGAVS